MTGLLTFGEGMGLISVAGIGTLDIAASATIGIGGAEANVAIGVTRLGQPATWIGRVGMDAMGDLVRRRLTAESIDARVLPDDSFTGLMVRHSRTAASTRVDYHRRGSAGSRLCADDIPDDLVRGAAAVHVTGITVALSTSAADAVGRTVAVADEAGVPVSLDVNYRRGLWDRTAARIALAPLVARADIVFAGVDEAQLLLDTTCDDPGDLARRLADLGPTEVIVKRGDHGCTALIDGRAHQRRAILVPVTDPVGAGDAFVAGYLAERLASAPPERRLDTAVAMGAYAVTVPGDCELLPSRHELDQLCDSVDIVR